MYCAIYLWHTFVPYWLDYTVLRHIQSTAALRIFSRTDQRLDANRHAIVQGGGGMTQPRVWYSLPPSLPPHAACQLPITSTPSYFIVRLWRETGRQASVVCRRRVHCNLWLFKRAVGQSSAQNVQSGDPVVKFSGSSGEKSVHWTVIVCCTSLTMSKIMLVLSVFSIRNSFS